MFPAEPIDVNASRLQRELRRLLRLYRGNWVSAEESLVAGNAVVDASILSGITFFTGLTALAGSHALSVDSLCILSSSVGVEFLTFLALKRGLIPQSQQKNAPAKPLRT